VLAPGTDDRPRPEVSIVGRPVRVPFNRSVAPICPSPLSALSVRRRLREWAPDIVHVHEPFTPSAAMFAALVSPAPVVATFHACADGFRLYRAMAPLLRVVERRCQHFLAVSEAAAQLVRDDLGLTADVVPNGVDVEIFGKATPVSLPEAPTLLFVGRLERRKGLTVLARAFCALVDRVPNIRLIVVGAGPEQHVLDGLSDAVRQRVVMLGALPDEALPGYYAAADLFVGPATGHESFGIVLLEAMAAGLPIVASDLAGYRCVVRDGIEGVLVAVGDATAMAGAIERVLTSPDLAGRLGAAGRLRASTFSWAAVAQRIEHVYEGLASRALQAPASQTADLPHRPRVAAPSASRVRNRSAM
jgi:phosphatidylinositol alpha-mannosyltransferase